MNFLALNSTVDDLRFNVSFSRNEFSAFARPDLIRPLSSDLVIDPYYGLAYQRMELLPAAIYGKTEDLPLYSGDQFANHGFLRVPFRRIPRRIVRNRAEIEAIVRSIRSADKELRILFRGQAREYLVKRNPETSLWLYGAESVNEPSLMTSASRRKPSLDSVLPEWCSLLRLFIQHRGDLTDKDFVTDSHFPLFALALAQHYGLPTSGLDVTNRLDVALFFALMKFEKSTMRPAATYTRPTSYAEMPVLYILSPSETQQFDYERYRSAGFPGGRPDAQSAHFVHIGWGHAINLCASRIFIALYLDRAGNFGPIPSARTLFPAETEDPFANFLRTLSDRKLFGSLGDVLSEGFYTISN